MDRIEEIIELLEKDYLDNDIDALPPKDRLVFYLNVKEFETPKMQRTTFRVGSDKEKDESEIKIKIVGDSGDESIPKTMGKTA